ncbi:SprT family zinc-dependent metalloprotease [Exiguobacterium marinum]|uniref:SprT family zinc-dependent metalloprotease n=1 Tax=Exiguobacterium marinum TaxID=273528 RepID=A0ABY7X2G5_9BACL|nr:SprT family zinc-dependent metalloprotease [Exiguobacterium marinum]WDH77292.1 SprT family zinc-dependent metalloprotease [Exiguobacterium marinum]
MHVNIIRNKRRKRAAFHVTPDGIELRIPERLPKYLVDHILEEHDSWIRDTLQNLPKQTSVLDEGLILHGKVYPTRKDDKKTIRHDGTSFLVPNSWDETTLWQKYETWLRERALHYVSERAPLYEERLDVRATNVRIAHQKTRWGSCSSNGTISINVRLMLAPIEIMDYVIAHEWTHLVHFDHSASFWKTLRTVYPEMDGAKAWLKQYGHTLQLKKPTDPF